jgi:hypothetical protein
VFERYRRADLSKADPKGVAGIVAIDKWMTRNRQAIELVLTSPHWPRDLLAEAEVRAEHPAPDFELAAAIAAIRDAPRAVGSAGTKHERLPAAERPACGKRDTRASGARARPRAARRPRPSRSRGPAERGSRPWLRGGSCGS